MTDTRIPQDSLVLYKNRPARVQQVAADKLAIEIEGGETVRVRPKDVTLLHPGPLRSLAELRPPFGDVTTAWEILAGSATTLPELAELAYGAFTPATAWAAQQLLADGLLFRGTAERVIACTVDEVAQTRAARAADAAEKRAWEAFIARAKAGQVAAEDRRYLREIEDLALGRAERSRVMRALGREESAENAHATLLEFGAWDDTMDPWPARAGGNLIAPALPLPAPWNEAAAYLRDPDRVDLTHLPAFAIDDASTDTPDDALSYEPGPFDELRAKAAQVGSFRSAAVPRADAHAAPGATAPSGEEASAVSGQRSAVDMFRAGSGLGRIWVHVADPAPLVTPDEPLDLEARSRGVTLHLPATVVPMLPPAATPLLGLGLAPVSPALSIAIDLDDRAEIAGVTVVPSLVHVTRLTYEVAQARIGESPLAELHRVAQACEARRYAAGAVRIDLPEANVRVHGGEIVIEPIPPLGSRLLVENAMVLAGEAIARYAAQHGIPLPYATQEPPDSDDQPEGVTFSAMYALRRTMKRSQYRSAPAPHSGLGLAAYAQATSPLRRYLDLVVHQQLRRHLAGEPPLDTAAILERIGEVEDLLAAARQAESRSTRHWTLAYLARRPDWRGPAVLLDKRGLNGTFVIPELALETQVHLAADLPLDSEVTLALRGVDLARQDARFRVEK